MIIQKIRNYGPSTCIGCVTFDSIYYSEKKLISNVTKMKKRVLVVDDSITARSGIVAELKALDFDVTVANDGFLALYEALKTPVDLIFSDYLMPRLDGYKTCFILKQHPQYKSVPFVILSASESMSHRQKAELMGVDLVVPKTRALGAMAEVVRVVLPDREQSE